MLGAKAPTNIQALKACIQWPRAVMVFKCHLQVTAFEDELQRRPWSAGSPEGGKVGKFRGLVQELVLHVLLFEEVLHREGCSVEVLDLSRLWLINYSSLTGRNPGIELHRWQWKGPALNWED
jgi:hypothetical protein